MASGSPSTSPGIISQLRWGLEIANPWAIRMTAPPDVEIIGSLGFVRTHGTEGARLYVRGIWNLRLMAPRGSVEGQR